MPLPEDERGGRVFGAVDEAAFFVPVDRGADISRQLRFQFGRILIPARHADERAREDEAAQPRRLRQGVLDREQTAPGRAEQVEGVQFEFAAHALDLLERTVERPEVLVGGPVGAAATKLVEEDDRALVGELGERLEVVVRKAGPAV